MYILGISAFYHDSTAALIKNGEIIAAAEEERFTRIRHDKSFPKNAVEFCLQFAEIDLKQISYIIFYDKPFLKFERILETYLLTAPWGSRSFSAAMTEWLSEGKLMLSYTLKKEFLKFSGIGANELPKLLFSEHHQSHAASAFFPSPFFEAAVLCVDGVGEWATTSCWLGKDNSLTRLWQIDFPHSLGLLYSAFTHYLGFRVNDGEYKLMGLAAHGTPRYISQIKKYLVEIKDDGSFCLNLNYFNYTTDLIMTNVDALFGGPPRKVDEKITQNHMDIASSIQNILEEILLRLVTTIKKETGQKNLCLAGDVAFNCVANTKIIDSGLFENVWIQPAAGDSGGALGAALLVWNQYLNKTRRICENDSMKGALLGPAFIQKNEPLFLASNLLNKELAELKKFGLKTGLFFVVLFYFSLPRLFYYKAGFWPWVVGALFVAIAFLKPQKLTLANKFLKIFWTIFLKTQGFVFWNLIYYFVFTPYALLARPWLKGFETRAERKYTSASNQEVLKNLHRQF